MFSVFGLIREKSHLLSRGKKNRRRRKRYFGETNLTSPGRKVCRTIFFSPPSSGTRGKKNFRTAAADVRQCDTLCTEGLHVYPPCGKTRMPRWPFFRTSFTYLDRKKMWHKFHNAAFTDKSPPQFFFPRLLMFQRNAMFHLHTEKKKLYFKL